VPETVIFAGPLPGVAVGPPGVAVGPEGVAVGGLPAEGAAPRFNEARIKINETLTSVLKRNMVFMTILLPDRSRA
jgi:hypothetical protein